MRLNLGRNATPGERDPHVVDAGQFTPGTPWAPEEKNMVQVRNYDAGTRPRKQPKQRRGPDQQRDTFSGAMLSLAGVVIAASAVGAGYVSYGSQKLSAITYLAGADKGHHRAAIIAALPDAGWISMALIGLVAALRARSSLRARVGVLLFFGLSLAAQVICVPKTTTGDLNWRALLIAVIAPIALAWMLESFVVEVRGWAAARLNLEIDESPILAGAIRGLGRGIRAGARFPLWLSRLVLAPKETGSELKSWFLDEAPIAPGRTRASMRADEAVERAGTAEGIAGEVRKQSAERIAQVQQTAAEQVAQLRSEVEQAREDAAERIAQAQQAAAEQVAQLRMETEQVQAAAAEQAERARREAEDRTAAALTQTGREAGQVRAEADRQIEQAREQMSAQLQEIRRSHEQQLAAQSRDAGSEMDRIRRQAQVDLQQLSRRTESEMQELKNRTAALQGENRRLQQELELLSGTATSKARLIAAYERLRLAGDPRYGNRASVSQIARELYEDAGLQSEGTARDYLAKHLSELDVDAVGALR